MKNKKNLYFLIPAVVIIWGLIIYRVIDFSEEEASNNIRPTRSALPSAEKKAAYDLKPAYPDPFLKNLADRSNSTVSMLTEEEPPAVRNVVAPIPQRPTVEITYKGFVTPTGENIRVALLTIAGKEVFLKAGESSAEILVRQIFADSVVLEIGGKPLTVKK